MGEKAWNKGEKEFKSKIFPREYKLHTYGKIAIEREKSIGCKACVEVCPMNLYLFNKKDNKENLRYHKKCINCNACVKKCLAQFLKIV